MECPKHPEVQLYENMIETKGFCLKCEKWYNLGKLKHKFEANEMLKNHKVEAKLITTFINEWCKEHNTPYDEECCICKRRLKEGKHTWIGLCCETGEWTIDEKKATQGYFAIGNTCFKNLLKKLMKKE